MLWLGVPYAMSISSSAGSHSLWMKVTYIRGETPFPELSAYMVLDDIEFGYYDSNQNKIIHRDVDKASDTGADAEDMDYVRHFVEYVHGRMKKRVSFFKNYFNHTNGKLIKRSNARHIK